MRRRLADSHYGLTASVDDIPHVARDRNLHAQIPPTFIVHSAHDKWHIGGSRVYHAALDEAKAAHEFKLYRTGRPYGYGLLCEGDARACPMTR